LYTNLDATEMIRTSEHAEGCRLDVYAFYHHQQLNELKRLAAEDPRPCLQLIIDEQAKTVTVVRQMDDGYTRGRGSVRRSAAYGDQQRRVTALIVSLDKIFQQEQDPGDLWEVLESDSPVVYTLHSCLF
ncbi:hypothetical protein T4B_11201, partial [Trichinella pseudospiralis]